MELQAEVSDLASHWFHKRRQYIPLVASAEMSCSSILPWLVVALMLEAILMTVEPGCVFSSAKPVRRGK